MKKYLIILSSVLTGLIIFWNLQNYLYKKIIDSCYEVGAQATNVQVEASAFLNNKKDKYDLSKRLTRGFKIIHGEYTEVEDEFLYNAVLDKGNLTLKIKDIEGKKYISLVVSQNAQDMNINNIKQVIFKNFLVEMAIPKFSLLVEGKFYGKMDTHKMKETAIKIVESKGAVFVNGIEQDNLVSVSAFLPTLEERKKCNNRFVNLNIALRYSSISNCTYIWIGSPLIFIEY